MSDVPDSATLSRAFGELFSGAKETFDGLQKELAGFLPSMPGMPVGKFGDLSVGIDMHPTVTPPSPVMAVPHVGKVYDIMAEIMAALAEMKISILSINAKTSDTKNVVIHMGISIKDLAQFEFVATKIRRLKDVYAVERYTGGSQT